MLNLNQKNLTKFLFYLTLFLLFIMLKVGGSLKKHNKCNKNMVLIGIVVPLLIFFAMINVTYAYFTARPLPFEGATTSGLVLVRLNGDIKTKINSTETTATSKLLPGDTLSVCGTVENAGTTAIYVLFELEILVTKQGSDDAEQEMLEYFTLVDGTATQINVTTNDDGTKTYSSTAFYIESANEDKTNEFTKDFEISHVFDGEKYNNDYKNASVTYTLKVTSIQRDSMEGSTHATEILMLYYDHKRCDNASSYHYMDCPICNPELSE